MGLDTTHDAFHGGYGSYSIMRAALMIAAGYRLKGDSFASPLEWDDDKGPRISDDPSEDNTDRPVWKRAELGDIDLDEWPWDPLLFLWAHQDCDGVIKPAMALAIAERIDLIMPRVEEATRTFAPAWAEPRHGSYGTDERTTMSMAAQFAAGLRRAGEAGETVEYH